MNQGEELIRAGVGGPQVAEMLVLFIPQSLAVTIPMALLRATCPVRYDVSRTNPHSRHMSAWQSPVERSLSKRKGHRSVLRIRNALNGFGSGGPSMPRRRARRPRSPGTPPAAAAAARRW